MAKQNALSSLIYKVTTTKGKTYYSYTKPVADNKDPFVKSPPPASEKHLLPKGNVEVVGDIHSHTVGRGFADQENFSKTTFAQDGDEKINRKLAGLDHYLLTPKGSLKVLRDDGEQKEIAYYDANKDDFKITEWFVGPKGRDKHGNVLSVDEKYVR